MAVNNVRHYAILSPKVITSNFLSSVAIGFYYVISYFHFTSLQLVLCRMAASNVSPYFIIAQILFLFSLRSLSSGSFENRISLKSRLGWRGVRAYSALQVTLLYRKRPDKTKC